MGGRSRAAAQILAGQGFAEVYNLKGGIRAWNGQTAAGPREMGMSHLSAEASPAEVLTLAYAMESGLGELYRRVGAEVRDDQVKTLVNRLATMEEGHKRKVVALLRKLGAETADLGPSDERAADIIEGGFSTETFLKENREAMESTEGVLTVAMALEAQALDLYMRYAQRNPLEEGRRVLFGLAEEEKSHLKELGRLMGKIA